MSGSVTAREKRDEGGARENGKEGNSNNKDV